MIMKSVRLPIVILFAFCLASCGFTTGQIPRCNQIESIPLQSIGAGFNILGVPIARDAALVEAGGDLQLTAQAKIGLLINAALPVRSIEDLVTLARATPGGLSFGSAGPGTGQHLNGELLKMRLGIPMQHVPYKGFG